mgnify:CR=1 FL=1
MATHDYNIANQGFPAFRSDLNNALSAIVSNNSNASAPSTTYAYQWWYDSSTTTLKFRNADNDAWISFATFDMTNDTVNLVDSAIDVVTDTSPQLGGNLDANSNNIDFDDATGIRDDSGNEQLIFQKTASAVNYAELTNAATGNDVGLSVTGSDTNVGLAISTKGSGKVKFSDSAYFPTGTLTDGATVNWDVQANQVAQVTLAGNRTFAAPTNMVDGGFYALIIIQDGTGSRTATFNSVFKFTGGTAPTLTTTAAARDILVFQSNGTNLYEVGRSLNPS